VIRVDEEDGVVGHYVRIILESLELRVEKHDPAMGVRSPHRYAEQLPRQHVGGAHTAADISRAARGAAAGDSLRPPQPEFDHRIALSRLADASSLGGDQALEIDEVEKRRLQELTLEDRSFHPDQRLVGEDSRSLRGRVHVNSKLQGAEVFQKSGFEERLAVVALQLGEVREI